MNENIHNAIDEIVECCGLLDRDDDNRYHILKKLWAAGERLLLSIKDEVTKELNLEPDNKTRERTVDREKS